MTASVALSHPLGLITRFAWNMLWVTALGLGYLSGPLSGAEDARPTFPPARARQPIASLALGEGRWLIVANRRSGSVSLLDVEQGRVIDELSVGGHLESLAGPLEAPAQAPRVLVVDSQQSRLVVIEVQGLGTQPRLLMVDSLSVVPAPYSVVWDVDRRAALVAGLWSHQWQFVSLEAPSQSWSLRLPFAPRSQFPLPGGRYVALADAFGGQFALVDCQTRRIANVWELPVHNIRGLTLTPDGKHLAFAHQTIDEREPVTRQSVGQGRLIRNGWSTLAVSELLGSSPGESQEFHPLDAPTSNLPSGARQSGARSGARQSMPFFSINPIRSKHFGASDPADLAWVDSRLCIPLAGTGQLAIGSPVSRDRTEGRDLPTDQSDQSAPDGLSPASQVRRVEVGARPLAIARLGQSPRLAVVNSLDDSVSIIDVRIGEVTRTVALGPPRDHAPWERGERLFFDGRLSVGGMLSCHSCHTDGHSNGRLADTLGDDTHGTPKRTLTLLGTGLTYRWAWNGTQSSLHEQVLKSLEQTMQGGGATFQHATDLVAYLHTLAPPPPLSPTPIDARDREQIERGRGVFDKRNCAQCHIPPIVYSSHESYDVGLADETGNRKFNPPSLRGVSQATRLLHDNRASSLEAVFRDQAHPSDSTYSRSEIEDLVRFLRSL